MPIDQTFRADLEKLNMLIQSYEKAIKREPGGRNANCSIKTLIDGFEYKLWFDNTLWVWHEYDEEFVAFKDLPVTLRIKLANLLPELLMEARRYNDIVHADLICTIQDLEQGLIDPTES